MDNIWLFDILVFLGNYGLYTDLLKQGFYFNFILGVAYKPIKNNTIVGIIFLFLLLLLLLLLLFLFVVFICYFTVHYRIHTYTHTY